MVRFRSIKLIDIVREESEGSEGDLYQREQGSERRGGGGGIRGSSCASAPRHGMIFVIPGLDSKTISRFDYSWRKLCLGRQSDLIMRREVLGFEPTSTII